MILETFFLTCTVCVCAVLMYLYIHVYVNCFVFLVKGATLSQHVPQ